MSEKDASKLKLGDTIATDLLPEGEHHEGEITDIGYRAFTAHWDDGQVGTVNFREAEKFYAVARRKVRSR